MTPKLKKCGVSSSSLKNCHEFGVKKSDVSQTLKKSCFPGTTSTSWWPPTATSRASVAAGWMRSRRPHNTRQCHRWLLLSPRGSVGVVCLFFCRENGGANTLNYLNFWPVYEVSWKYHPLWEVSPEFSNPFRISTKTPRGTDVLWWPQVQFIQHHHARAPIPRQTRRVRTGFL